jgi:hypothetical protein
MNSAHDLLAEGFPHSDIRGSTIARISPRLFAACHVLHRLLAPRHPPNALITLENTSNTARAQDQTAQDDRSPPPAWTMCGRRRHYSCLSQLTHTSDKPSHPTAGSPQREAPAARADNPSAKSDSPSQRTCPHQAKSPGGKLAREVENQTQRQSALRMEASGFEPLTPCLQSRCSTS